MDGLDIVTGENVNHVITGAEDAVIDGFIVINGDASGNSDEGHGGGLFFNGTSMTISNCTFKNNSAVYGGGIFFDEDSAPVLDNCIFETNQAHYGGAIYLGKNSAPSLDECEFINNSASSDGGALFMGVNTAPDIRLMMNDLIFTGNNANGLGGALCALGIVHISNNTFSGNHAQMGGAIFVQNNETLISATAFDGNNAERDGGALYNFWSLSMDSDSSFTNNSAGGNGGALYNDASVTPEETITVDVEGVLFEGNRAAGLGGSLFINRGPGSYNGCVFNASNGGLITQHANKGGAVYNDRGSAEFINCEFEGFTALEGGAIYNNTVTSVYTGCSFLNNLSDAGGAVYNSGGLPGFVQCSFSGNDASAEGGALYNTRSSFNIENSAITSNISPQGGGMYNNLCPAPLIINTEFRGNGNANSVGSAVYNYMSNTSLINDLLAGNGNIPLFNNTSSPRIIHCTIAWNGNYAVYNSNGSMPVIINSVLCSNPYYLRIQRDKMASEGDPVIQIFDEDETDSADVSNSCLYQTDGNYAGSQNNILQAVEFYTVDHYKMRYTWTETYVNSNDDTVTETVQNQCLDAGTVDIDSDILDEITGKMSIRSSLDEFIDLEGTDTIPDPGYHSVP